MIKKILKFGQIFYESRFAPFIARYFPWLYWPLYRICRSLDICFVVNIAGGSGHIICELDYFFRKLDANEIDKNKRYVWLRKADPYSIACAAIYGKRFWFVKCNYFVYDLFLPLIMAYHDITEDCGLSRLKWQLDSDRKYYRPLPNQTYLYQITKKRNLAEWCKYYSLRKTKNNYYPLTLGEFKPNDLSFLRTNRNGDAPIALIHIKTDKKNATALPTDPKTYLPSFEYLIERGYQLVFVGRESMPDIFNSFPIFNYAQSPFANFKNDIQLFNQSDLFISSGSGVAFLADCYGKPYLYLNSWHLSMAMFSPKCITVPSLVRRKNGDLLTFKQQIELYHHLDDKGEEVFPENEFDARNASEDEILAAVQEMLSPSSSLTIEQDKFRKLIPDTPLFFSESRCSDYFLKKHSLLLLGNDDKL